MKKLYHGAEQTLFGILYLDEQRRQATMVKLDKTQLAKLQAENWERFEAEQRDIRAWSKMSHPARIPSPNRLILLDLVAQSPYSMPFTHLHQSPPAAVERPPRLSATRAKSLAGRRSERVGSTQGGHDFLQNSIQNKFQPRCEGV
ncbi:hypothetical protein BKA70DRAFT_1439376 [Coprinopsis sp. MPI-PUGE-AT-0042]|nr:hypothetical protein BKA70DRAFT_1439376 [Coprinopsis sp. MPI-PUGE-AT-0042]